MGVYTTFGIRSMIQHWTLADRLAEARFRPASTRASISGQYYSTITYPLDLYYLSAVCDPGVCGEVPGQEGRAGAVGHQAHQEARRRHGGSGQVSRESRNRFNSTIFYFQKSSH